MDRLILDTSVVVAGERGPTRLDDLLGDEDDVAVAAITVAELLVGVELADAANRARRRALVEAVVATIPGRSRGAHDLVVAATALARDRIVVTADRGGFDGLPGVAVRVAPGSAMER